MHIQDNIKWIGLPKKVVLWALVYSFIFPVTYLIGGMIATIGVLVTFPFLPGAWIVSKGFVYLFGNGNIYLFGLFVGILIQVSIVAMLSKKCFYLESKKECISCLLPKMALFTFIIFGMTILYFAIEFSIHKNKRDNAKKHPVIIEIAKQLNTNKNQSIDFSTIGKEDWTRICFLGPYNRDSEKVLGFDWNVSKHTDVLISDGHNVILFATDKKLIDFIELPRNQGDFWKLSGECFDRNNSDFVIGTKTNSFVKNDEDTIILPK
jgi:hypothetical protein